MKLIIREYLMSLRERKELDAILPDLLTEMGFIIFSRPSIGTRQYGVDIAGVGDGADGVKRVHLFSVKSGDLTRQDWDGEPAQSLRPSLNEIRDHYISSRIPIEYRALPIAICICFGGTMHESVRPQVTGYFESNRTDRISYEEWNGDRLANVVLSGILQERTLPPKFQAHLRKSVALVGEPEASIGHFTKLASAIVDESDPSVNNLTKARLLNIALWILFVWGRDADNLKAPYRASHLVLLQMWRLFQLNKPSATHSAKKSASLNHTFSESVNLHHAIWTAFFKEKIIPHATKRDALASAVRSNAYADVNLRLFDVLGSLALRGLWMVWEISAPNLLPIMLSDYRASHDPEIDALCEDIINIIRNNQALLSPLADEQVTAIGMAITFLACRKKYHQELREWIVEMLESLIFAFRIHGHYPTTDREYADIAKHPHEQTDEYRASKTCASTIIPTLALWAEALGDCDTLRAIHGFQTQHLSHCNLQFWMADSRSEAEFHRGGRNHGSAWSDMPLLSDRQTILSAVLEECARDHDFFKSSMISSGNWPVFVVGCYHARLPLPPNLWQHLLDSIRRSET